MKLSLVLFVLNFLMSNCGPQNSRQEESHVQFAELDYYYGAFKGLYNGGVKFCVTGPLTSRFKSPIADSYFKWIKEIQKIDRDVYPSISYTCVNPDYYIQTFNSVGRAHATRGGLVRLYQNSDGATVTHELGHMIVGLGDTYVEGVWNCKPGQPLSIMCSTQLSGNRLLRDDIMGLRAQFAKHSTLDKPDNVAKHIRYRLPLVYKCPKLSSLFKTHSSQLRYENGRASIAYITFKFSDEARHTIKFPYSLDKETVLNRNKSSIWQALVKFDPSLKSCAGQ